MNWKQTPIFVVLLGAAMLLTACKPTNDDPSNTAPVNAGVQSALKFQGLDLGKVTNADRSVPPLTMFASEDKIIASVRTDGVAKDVPVSVKLIAMTNGQVLSELNQKVTTSGPATTNFEFPKSTPWLLGRYLVEVAINGKFEARQEIEIRQDGPPNPLPEKEA